MSDADATTAVPTGRGSRAARAVVLLAAWLVLLAAPLFLQAFWLQVGLFAMSSAVGAIGLNLLMGTAGQLSLGHAFFVALGAYGYAWAAGDSGRHGAIDLVGLGLPPVVAFAAAVLLAGLAGVLFSPVAGRVRGLYLAVATMALVYVGQHVMLNARSLTGGFNGRSIPDLAVLGFSFSDHDPDSLMVLGVPLMRLERLWYVGLALVAIAWLVARNLLRGRPGRALGALRDSELAASVMGVPAVRYRAAAFTISSMYAGAAGALLGLVYERVVPDSFGFMVSINFVAMIVIGGLGSVGGAVAGAVFVTTLPQLLSQYAGSLPFVVPPGSLEPGITPVEASSYLYGLAILLTLVFAPGGIAGVATALAARMRRGRRAVPAASPQSHHPQPARSTS